MENPKDIGSLKVLSRDWENLLANPAWAILVDTLQAQADQLQQAILFAPVGSDADMWERERKIGKLQGLLSVTETVESMQQELSLDLLNAKETVNE